MGHALGNVGLRSGMGGLEDHLLRRYVHDGDVEAREELVRRLRPLMRRLALRCSGGEYVEDLEQAAAFGLVKALERYDAERGGDLLRYAIPTMTGEMRRWLRDHSWAIRPPRGLAEQALRLTPAIEHLGARYGRTPTVAEIGRHLGLSVEDVRASMEAARVRRAVSLDAPAGDDGRVIGDAVGFEDEDLRHAFERLWMDWAREELEPREREVVALRFDEGLSQRQIARRVGISQMQVCRVLARALEHLREADRRASFGLAS
jgi:RNA polymerase sigma-B factor